MSKIQAARAFCVSLSSVKRYMNKANRREPLAPKKSPGSAPKLDEKAVKLLEKDLKGGKEGADERTRTADLLITSERFGRQSAARTSSAFFRLLPISTGPGHPRSAGRGI